MKTVEQYLSLNYKTSVYRDDDGDFIVEVIDLPGCVADGKTPNEAFGNLHNAMRSWIESRIEAGLSIPEPRSTDAFSGRVLLRMPRYLHERLSGQAENQGASLNQYMVSLLSEASAPAQVQQSQSRNVASIAACPSAAGFAYQGSVYHPGFIGPTFVNPNLVLVNVPNTAYLSYKCDYGIIEDWQQNLVVRASVPRASVSLENQKEPVLKPQIVPKQQQVA